MRTVVIGASAGGVEALKAVARGLDPRIDAAVFVVLHVRPDEPSLLPKILRKAGSLDAVHVGDGEEIERGRIYVAPPDNHMLLEPGRVRLTRGPRENRQRPSADPLFRSAAASYGDDVIAVVLSGVGEDGRAGLLEVAAAGGTVVVQDPDDCPHPGMPLSAIRSVKVDAVLPAEEIGRYISKLATARIPTEWHDAMRDEEKRTHDAATADLITRIEEVQEARPSQFSCPECGGVLWEVDDSERLRYRCRVGHAYTPDALLVDQSHGLEMALWASLRALEERASLLRRMAGHSRTKGGTFAANYFDGTAIEVEGHSGILRELLEKRDLFRAQATDGPPD